MIIFSKLTPYSLDTDSTAWVDFPTAYRITIKKTGNYRIRYTGESTLPGGTVGRDAYFQIFKNGILLVGSEMNTRAAVSKVLDVSLAVGDILQLQGHGTFSSTGDTWANPKCIMFVVSVSANDLTNEFLDIFSGG